MYICNINEHISNIYIVLPYPTAERNKSDLPPFWLFVCLFVCVCVVTPEVQLEALCCYLALPSNLFQLFHTHLDTVDPLLQRYLSKLLIHTHAHIGPTDGLGLTVAVYIKPHTRVFVCL